MRQLFSTPLMSPLSLVRKHERKAAPHADRTSTQLKELALGTRGFLHSVGMNATTQPCGLGHTDDAIKPSLILGRIGRRDGGSDVVIVVGAHTPTMSGKLPISTSAKVGKSANITKIR